MKNRLNSMAGILIFIWAIGFFAFKADTIINVLLAISFFAIILGLFHEREVTK